MSQDDEERLEELRQQKMEKMKEQQQGGGQGQQEAQQQAQQQAEQQKQAMLRQYLSDGARRRLNSVRMSKPDLAERVEQQVVALGRSGRIQDQLDEEQMKSLLRELKPDEQSFNISRR